MEKNNKEIMLYITERYSELQRAMDYRSEMPEVIYAKISEITRLKSFLNNE